MKLFALLAGLCVVSATTGSRFQPLDEAVDPVKVAKIEDILSNQTASIKDRVAGLYNFYNVQTDSAPETSNSVGVQQEIALLAELEMTRSADSQKDLVKQAKVAAKKAAKAAAKDYVDGYLKELGMPIKGKKAGNANSPPVVVGTQSFLEQQVKTFKHHAGKLNKIKQSRSKAGAVLHLAKIEGLPAAMMSRQESQRENQELLDGYLKTKEAEHQAEMEELKLAEKPKPKIGHYAPEPEEAEPSALLVDGLPVIHMPANVMVVKDPIVNEALAPEPTVDPKKKEVEAAKADLSSLLARAAAPLPAPVQVDPPLPAMTDAWQDAIDAAAVRYQADMVPPVHIQASLLSNQKDALDAYNAGNQAVADEQAIMLLKNVNTQINNALDYFRA